MVRQRSFDRWLSEGRKLIAERVARKQQIEAELADIDRQLVDLPAVMGARVAAPRRRGRPPGRRAAGRPRGTAGGKTLPEMVREVLASATEPLSIKAIESAVLKRGYKTKSDSIYNAVSTTLHKTGAERVNRGKYVAESAGGGVRKKRRSRRAKKSSR
jgi:hypothetical protein